MINHDYIRPVEVILRYAEEGDPFTLSEIAEDTGMMKRRLSAALRRMCQQRYLVRTQVRSNTNTWIYVYQMAEVHP